MVVHLWQHFNQQPGLSEPCSNFQVTSILTLLGQIVKDSKHKVINRKLRDKGGHESG